MKKFIQFPFIVFITTEGKWFISECPLFNIATQGRTEKEAKENIKDLIVEYLKDSDISKEFAMSHLI
jgi:predicted RNase H-like HicB family nuclease